MTDVRKLLGRLNPANIRYDIGSGGWEGLTAQDVAAALGMVPRGLGRELLAWCWWPDGAALRGDALAEEVTELLLREHARRADQLILARRRLLQAQTMADLRRVVPAGLADEIRRAKAAAGAAKDEAWPEEPAMLAKLARAALEEMRSPSKCGHCEGRGQVMVAKLLRPCPKCDGTGAAAPSDSGRARALDRHLSTYQERWAAVWDWLAAELRDAEAAAARQMARALQEAA